MIRRLPIQLTDAERNVKARHAASLVHERTMLEEQKKETAAEYAERIKDLSTKITAAVEAARTGIEERDVEVNPKPNNEAFVVEFYRDDTGELVESRPMTDEEIRVARQRELPLRGSATAETNLRAVGAPISPLRGNTRNGTTT